MSIDKEHKPQVSVQSGLLNDAAETLYSLSMDLEDRLVSVLGEPKQAEVVAETNPQLPFVPLASDLRETLEKLRNAIGRMRRILDTIEL